MVFRKKKQELKREDFEEEEYNEDSEEEEPEELPELPTPKKLKPKSEKRWQVKQAPIQYQNVIFDNAESKAHTIEQALVLILNKLEEFD